MFIINIIIILKVKIIYSFTKHFRCFLFATLLCLMNYTFGPANHCMKLIFVRLFLKFVCFRLNLGILNMSNLCILLPFLNFVCIIWDLATFECLEVLPSVILFCLNFHFFEFYWDMFWFLNRCFCSLLIN